MRALSALALLAWASPVRASCYDLPQTRVLAAHVTRVEQAQVSFMVDQSTSIPGPVRQQVLDSVDRLAVPGSQVSVGSFSSYSGSRFPQVVLTVQFDQGLPPALNRQVSRRARDLLASCIAYRRRQGIQQLQAALQARFDAARTSIEQSDIMSSIQQFGAQLRASPAPDKVLVIVSDMLENSSSSSFYRRGRLRAIDPAAETRNAVSRGLLADLRRARVFVVGMALQPGEGTTPADLVQRLERFWLEYFRRSNAAFARIGKPLLLEPIR